MIPSRAPIKILIRYPAIKPESRHNVQDKRNIVIAMVLAALILFGWPYLTAMLFPDLVQERPAATANAAPGAAPGAATNGATAAAPNVGGAAGQRDVTAVLADSQRVPIETPTLRGSINLANARIDDLVLVNYRQTVERNSPPIRLFSPSSTANAYFAGMGWSDGASRNLLPTTPWRLVAGTKLTPTTPITLEQDNGQGQTFSLTLSVDNQFMFKAVQRVTNRGAAAVAVSPYAYISRVGTSPDADSWTIHTGAMGVFNDKAEYINTSDIDEAPGSALSFANTQGWAGFTDKYWLSAVVPDSAHPATATIKRGAQGVYQADFVSPAQQLAPGRMRETETRFFAGAKDTAILDAYMDQGVTMFDHATDWGWFGMIAKPIFYLLDWLFKHIGNFGFAIMALTLIIRLLMFPIAQKQFKSMAAMRLVQPKVKALQERYADDKPRQQQEMMALYKTEKINPLAGCLPVLIQIPIFYALYKSLMVTVEMRHQPFIGWIHDLSAPDPKHILNLFGLLDFTPPAFLGIGVLAVLLGVTMWAQFRLNPTPADPVQAQVMGIMPWMLMFVMAPFAAGLLVYWITNNLLAIAQQRLLYLRHPEMKEAVAAK